MPARRAIRSPYYYYERVFKMTMVCINDTFFTVNGRVTDENRLRKQILDTSSMTA